MDYCNDYAEDMWKSRKTLKALVKGLKCDIDWFGTEKVPDSKIDALDSIEAEIEKIEFELDSFNRFLRFAKEKYEGEKDESLCA